MKHFSCVLEQLTLKEKDWLLVGKGPTFEKVLSVNLGDYITMGINHVVSLIDVDVLHVADIDVLDDAGGAIEKKARYLLMPLYPHENNKPSLSTLDHFIEKIPLLRKMNEAGRLLWYNSSLAGRVNQEYPVVAVKYFSADAAVALLASNGVKRIRTAGIDGATEYNKNFSGLSEKTRLSNGQSSFDKQFRAIAATIMNTGVEILPLIMDDYIRVYVGAEIEQSLALKVLEYSILKNTNSTVKVTPLYSSGFEISLPTNKENRPRTPFSFQRFLIPKLNNYKGRAIYLDSDMQVFFDIRDLNSRDFVGKNLLSAYSSDEGARKPQFSVMLLDCGSLNWDAQHVVDGLDLGRYSYSQLMQDMAVADVGVVLEPEWNSLESYQEGLTKLLHYTDMNIQPWISRKNKYLKVWVDELREAIIEGAIDLGSVVSGIRNQELRPSLFVDLFRSSRYKKFSDKKIYRICKLLDKGFVPPHRRAAGERKGWKYIFQVIAVCYVNYKYKRYRIQGCYE
ncbi:hypothetical protein [Marinagarivorans cellulosilyticus]|uniref:Uncharacterized protein n=1 Tax=Marinagarivorans cellulosilyticus TaxID=2721545 RepID=A0AAN1WHB0_9GAMM|nr:hypothetical protein [Marinagarivorans cellulosilyticus]BCD97535.1 hypothetical protein MARGE09_P1736 [Marinagarivorans cellulosilyticus]